MKRITSFQQSGERYASLRVVAFFFKLLGFAFLGCSGLLLAIGLYILGGGTIGTPPPQGLGPFAGQQASLWPLSSWLGATLPLIWSLAFLISGLQMIAIAVLFQLMIHLEENTRATAQILDRIRSRMEPVQEGFEPLFRT